MGRISTKAQAPTGNSRIRKRVNLMVTENILGKVSDKVNSPSDWGNSLKIVWASDKCRPWRRKISSGEKRVKILEPLLLARRRQQACINYREAIYGLCHRQEHREMRLPTWRPIGHSSCLRN